MRAHKLAKWLLEREDSEVYLEKDSSDIRLKDLNVGRKIFVSGIVGGAEGTPIILHFRGELTKEEEIDNRNKRIEIERSHPDRLLSLAKEYSNDKSRVLEIVKEAKEKGYTILPAHDPKAKKYGFVIYKEIEGVEVAHNPQWPEAEGMIEL
jgi:hypothetical protein